MTRGRKVCNTLKEIRRQIAGRSIIDEKNIFTGMRSGIARINLETRISKFHKNNN